ncbi:hypothetical protein MKW98_021082 [Papaver atlanticum]|uniref:Thioredoxin-dependent peroxiredoxin n=1 Tax=Papaver atlanticum TaxID=357466 RepID=A0AAD4XTY7_9MAGN|nr:hypothetical protein MKW98_021082 [Papaver atlanticum]
MLLRKLSKWWSWYAKNCNIFLVNLIEFPLVFPLGIVMKLSEKHCPSVRMFVNIQSYWGTWELDDFESHPVLLVMFISNHCPFVIHLKQEIVKLTTYYMKNGLAVIAISSNSVLFKYPFPYLYRESEDVARALGAVCTSVLLYKKDGRRPFELVTGRDLGMAIDSV